MTNYRNCSVSFCDEDGNLLPDLAEIEAIVEIASDGIYCAFSGDVYKSKTIVNYTTSSFDLVFEKMDEELYVCLHLDSSDEFTEPISDNILGSA